MATTLHQHVDHFLIAVPGMMDLDRSLTLRNRIDDVFRVSGESPCVHNA
jgi:hypothetical protein